MPEPTDQLRESLDQQSVFYRHLLRLIGVCLGIMVLVVGLGVGVVVYYVVSNAPKIDCIYRVSLSTNHDIYHLITAHDSNIKHYSYAKCK